MKKYRCFKEVHAFKITGIAPSDYENGAVLTGDNDTFVAIPAFMLKHGPRVGDYVVQYADGYVSCSPAKAFEEGYVDISSEAASEPTR